MDINEIRKKIDEVDDELAALFERRMELARLIAEEKRKAGLPLVNTLREKEIIDRVLSALPADIKPYGEQLFKTLFEMSKAYQSAVLDASSLVNDDTGAAKDSLCVIGKSLPHTLSPEIHIAFGAKDYRVEELEDESALEEFVRSRRYVGYNVTIPYKQAVMPLLDEVSETARDVGAVNTVIERDGRLFGYNTDVEGMKYALDRAGIGLSGKNVLILGSGGTSHTARYLCAKEGARRVDIASRSGSLNYDNCYDLRDVEIIINTTPVGMMPSSYERPIDIFRYPMLEGVFDAIYNPLATLIVLEARARGIKAANGLDMLVEQARLAHNIFFAGESIEDETESERVCRELMWRRQNIVLVGMAGAGKTTIGRELAKALGKEFYDTDAQVVKAAGKDIPAIFAEEGEAKFRSLEKAAVRECCMKLGAVIATGGGAVLDEKNRFYMRSNGKVVFLTRDISALSRKDRPLSTDEDRVAALYEEREPIYRRVADICVNNGAEISDAVKSILKELEK